MKTVLSLVCFVAGILSFTEAVEQSLEKSCVTNGGSTALTNMRRSEVKAKEYFNSVQAEFMQSLQINPSQPELAFAKICDKVKDQSLTNHLKDVIESAKACLDKTTHESLDITFKIVVSILKFGCNNTKQLLKAMTDKPGMACVSSKSDAMKTCSEVFTARIPNSNTPNLMEPPANVTDLLVTLRPSFATAGCSKILTFEQCTVKVLKQCESEVFHELLDSLYKYVNDNVPCDNLPKLTKSGASPTSVASFMILFISLLTVSF